MKFKTKKEIIVTLLKSGRSELVNVIAALPDIDQLANSEIRTQCNDIERDMILINKLMGSADSWSQFRLLIGSAEQLARDLRKLAKRYDEIAEAASIDIDEYR